MARSAEFPGKVIREICLVGANSRGLSVIFNFGLPIFYDFQFSEEIPKIFCSVFYYWRKTAKLRGIALGDVIKCNLNRCFGLGRDQAGEKSALRFGAEQLIAFWLLPCRGAKIAGYNLAEYPRNHFVITTARCYATWPGYLWDSRLAGWRSTCGLDPA